MSITAQQSRLIDEKSKNKHIEDTGYDYTKQVQSEIQLLVEAHLEFEEDLRLTSLVPKVGITNGVTITEADRNAYIAAHPQNVARKSDRLRIADLLAAGNSTLDEQEQEEELQEQRETPKPNIHKRFPPVADISYHKANQTAETYRKAEAKEENFHRLLDNNEEVVVIDDFVGKDGELAFAKSLRNPSYGEFYVSRNKISLVENSPFATPYDFGGAGTKPTGGEMIPWTSLPMERPTDVPQTGEVHIVVYLERRTLTTADRPAALEEAFYLGMEKILKSRGKKNTRDYIKQSFVENQYWDKPAQAYELFLDPRRVGAKVKAAVKVPVRNIVPLEDEEVEFKHKEEYRIEKFKSMIDKLATKVRDIKEKKEEFISEGGKVLSFFPSITAAAIRNVPKNIEYVASRNSDYSKTGKNIFEDKGRLKLYWNEQAQPVMIRFHSDAGKVYNFNEEMREYRSRIGSDKRTQDLIMNMDFIIENEMETPWKEFLTTFVQYKPVKIIPKEETVEKEGGQGEAEGPKVKTAEELEKENNFYSNTERRKQAYEERKNKSDFTGSPTLNPANESKIGEIISQDAEDLYDHFLNKVDIAKIALSAAKCLLPDIPLDSLRLVKRDFDILKKELEKLKKEFMEGKLLDFLMPDDFPTDDISAAFFKTLRRELEKIIVMAITSLVGSLLSAFFVSCSKRDKNQQDPNLPNPPELDDALADLQNKMDDLFDAGFVDPTTFKNLMEDLANILSLRELCDLLRGQPDRDTLDIVKNLLETAYCGLELNTDQEVIDFFLAVSGSMDLSICDELGTIIETLPEDFVCPPDSLARTLLLTQRGLTEEEVKEQMDRERERNAKLAEQLLGDALRGTDGRGPNLFCAKDEEGNTVPGVMPFMDAQFEYTFESTISSMFKSTYDSFTEEGLRYAQNLFLEVEEKEEKEYDMLGPIPEEADNRPVGPQFTKEVLVTKRKPVPHLADFYNEPEMESTNNSLEITIPNQAVSAIDKAKEMFGERNENNIEILRSLENVKNSLKAQEDSNSKMIITELNHCEVLERTKEEVEEEEEEKTEEEKRIESIEKEIKSKADRIAEINVELEELEDEIRQSSTGVRPTILLLKKKNLETERERLINEREGLQEDLTRDVYGMDLKENDCGDGAPTVEPTARERQRMRFLQEVNREIQVSNLDRFPAYPLTTIQPECQADTIIGTTVEIGDKEYFSKKEINEGIISFMNQNVGSNSPRNRNTCIQAIFNKSLELEELGLTREERDRRRQAFINSSPTIANNVRDGIYKILMKMLSESKYLTYQSFESSPEEPSYDRYVMEFINLGPTPTPECDPHLLKLSQLLEEMKDGMQEAMCLDLNPPEENGKPRMSPLESAMMKACIKATFRHYIIESLVTGILTLTTFEGRRTEMAEIKCSYIIDKMRDAMNNYSKPQRGDSCSGDTFSGDMPKYFEDFVEQVEKTYEGENDEYDSLLRRVLKEEYKIIAEGLMDALLIPDTRDSGILYKFLLEEVPVVVPARQINEMTFTTFENGSTQQDEFDNPFIYFKSEGKEYFSLVIKPNSIDATLRNNYNDYLMPNGFSHRLIIPIIERANLETLLVQSALFTTFFPLHEYASSISIHEMETVSRMESTVGSFGETRDNLFSLFYAIAPEKDDWGKQNKALSSMGGSSGLTKLFDFNNNVFDTPCTEFSYNFGFNGLCWGNPFAGLGGMFAMALRLARDAALLQFKNYVKMNDPAVKLAARLSFLSKLACVNIPTSAIAGGLNSALPLIFPLTPMAKVFHALGLGVFLPASLLNSDSDEGQEARDQIRGAGLRLPPYCGAPVDEREIPEDQLTEEDREFLRMQAEHRAQTERDFNSKTMELGRVETEINELKREALELLARIGTAMRMGNNALKNSLQERKNTVEEEIEILEESKTNIEAELSQLRTELERINSPLLRKMEIMERIPQIETELEQVESEIITADMQNNRAKLTSAENRKESLEDELAGLREEYELLSQL